MTQVFLVTSGDYSSYHIEGAFSTRPKAKAYIAWRGAERWDAARIETRALDVAPETLRPLQIRMSKEGSVLDIWKKSSSLEGFDAYDMHGNLVWAVATTDEERAVKVVNEKRGQLIAMGVWGDPVATRKLLRTKEQKTEAP